MLSSQNDIYAIEPPFLILYGDGSWRVARELFPYQDGVGFVEPFADQASRDAPSGVVPGKPWHVGDDFLGALLHFRGIHGGDESE